MGEFETYRVTYQFNGGFYDIIVGSFPNAISMVLGSLLLAIIWGREKFLSSTSSYAIGQIIYEIWQIFLPERTFDVWDIVMTLAVWASLLKLNFLVSYVKKRGLLLE
ncbi:MAG: hypothetical protein K0U59_02050 [Gammaproteobacteria bacterium]|nr:hypothetical protein [Gammaproteobacteria bacterium]